MNQPASTDGLLPAPDSVHALEEVLSQPTPAVIEMMSRLEGDLVLLGVGGKMGPSMARMARRAWARMPQQLLLFLSAGTYLKGRAPPQTPTCLLFPVQVVFISASL